MSAPDVNALIAKLWPNGDRLDSPQVHMLLDGAMDPDISRFVRKGKLDFECLFAGPLTPRLEAAAPYIVRLEVATEMTRILLERAWGRHWGIVTIAHPYITTRQQCIHFKKFLRVRDEAGIEMAFRFYDPRVLRLYLPTCTARELSQFLGPIDSIIAQSDDAGSWIRFARVKQDGGVTIEPIFGQHGNHNGADANAEALHVCEFLQGQ